MSSQKTVSKRPVGRPRANGKAQLTRDALLQAAAKLITRNGYTGTSIRMIAAELDITTASIFNLYPSKEKLLNSLIIESTKPFLSFYQELNALEFSPAVALYKSIVEEAKTVGSFDRDYVSIFNLPEMRRPEFAEVQAVRKKMVGHYRQLIEQGQANGEFVLCDLAWTAEQIFQLTETGASVDEALKSLTAEDGAKSTADFCLRGLLADPAVLMEIQSKYAQIDLSIFLDA